MANTSVCQNAYKNNYKLQDISFPKSINYLHSYKKPYLHKKLYSSTLTIQTCKATKMHLLRVSKEWCCCTHKVTISLIFF